MKKQLSPRRADQLSIRVAFFRDNFVISNEWTKNDLCVDKTFFFCGPRAPGVDKNVRLRLSNYSILGVSLRNGNRSTNTSCIRYKLLRLHYHSTLWVKKKRIPLNFDKNDTHTHARVRARHNQGRRHG